MRQILITIAHPKTLKLSDDGRYACIQSESSIADCRFWQLDVARTPKLMRRRTQISD
jgi:hypothetical protein